MFFTFLKLYKYIHKASHVTDSLDKKLSMMAFCANVHTQTPRKANEFGTVA